MLPGGPRGLLGAGAATAPATQAREDGEGGPVDHGLKLGARRVHAAAAALARPS